MDAKRLSGLLAKKLSGEATGAELQELEQYLLLHPDDKYVHDIISGWWNPATGDAANFDSEKEVHFDYILSQVTAGSDTEGSAGLITEKRTRRIVYRSAAAAILLTVSLAVWKYWLPLPAKNTSQAANEIVTQKGTRSKVLLPDGSSVMLNADSKLLYAADRFNDSVREVVLEGEAFFDVVKDPARPFIVHTTGINIRVVGTAFNVKSYPKESTVEATLLRGIIEVQKTGQPHTSTIILKPNEKLVYKKPGFEAEDTGVTGKKNTDPAGINTGKEKENISISTLPKVKSDSVRSETSWMYGKLLFEGESFKQLAPAMERWFNVKINFSNDKVAAVRFRGVFENESIQEALQAMQLTAPFSYSITGNTVVIGTKK